VTRKLAALATLSKLNRQQLDFAAGRLSDLQDQRAAIDFQLQELDRVRAEETNITLPEAMPYLNRFLESARSQQRELEEAAANLDAQIERQKEEVLQAWQDSEKTDHIRNKEDELIRFEAERQEQIARDEQTIIGYARDRRFDSRDSIHSSGTSIPDSLSRP
jgi:hypothetical protein